MLLFLFHCYCCPDFLFLFFWQCEVCRSYVYIFRIALCPGFISFLHAPTTLALLIAIAIAVIVGFFWIEQNENWHEKRVFHSTCATKSLQLVTHFQLLVGNGINLHIYTYIPIKAVSRGRGNWQINFSIEPLKLAKSESFCYGKSIFFAYINCALKEHIW